jgi:hypothetical protein
MKKAVEKNSPKKYVNFYSFKTKLACYIVFAGAGVAVGAPNFNWSHIEMMRLRFTDKTFECKIANIVEVCPNVK